MKRKFSLYQFIVAAVIFLLMIPAFASAETASPAGFGGGGKGGYPGWPWNPGGPGKGDPDPEPPVEEVEGSLTIYKYAQGKKKDNPAGTGEAGQNAEGDPVEGVTFTVIQTHTYDPETNTWTPVGSNAPTYHLTTDSSGQVSKDLPLGRYQVQETNAPDHIVMNTKKFYVEIPMTNKAGTKLNYDVHIYPKNQKVKGNVKLTKTDGDKQFKNALKGVKFELYNAEDDSRYNNEVYTTNHNGIIFVENLPYGDYYFKEIATQSGYVLGNPKVEFSIKKNQKTVNVHVKNYVEPEVEKSVDKNKVNRGETVTFSIKSTLPGDIGSYKTYKITDELDSRLSYVDGYWTVSGIDSSAINFSQNGQTLTWEITNFNAVKHKKNFTISFKAKVSEDAIPNKKIPNKGSVEYENKYKNGGEKETNTVKVVPTAGKVTIIKQDAKKDKYGKHKRLSGAKFELRDNSGNVVREGTTNSDGELIFKDVDYGEYTLHETKAPKHYRLMAKPIDVTVDENNHDKTYTIDNYKKDYDLPATGGIGTMLFTFIGLSLMGTASLMIFRRRNGETM